MKRLNLPNSGSKWFLPMHAVIMTGVFIFSLWANDVFASDENGDRYCLAQNIYFEAANQPLAGRIAVAQVVLNRVNDSQFPDTICNVVYQAKLGINWKGKEYPVRNMCQFSWFCDGKSDEPTDSITWMDSIRVADSVLWEQSIDLTEGALWYHNDKVDPYWNDYLTQTIIINNHIFYK